MNDFDFGDLLVRLGVPFNTAVLLYIAWLYRDVRALVRHMYGNGRKGILDRLAEIEAGCKARHHD